jgi:hypothetical protein
MSTTHRNEEREPQRGDFLVGYTPIRDFLIFIGMPETVDPYYLKRAGDWPIGKTGGATGGGMLFASKRELVRHAENIARGRARADKRTPDISEEQLT